MTTIERKKLEQVLEALTYCEALNKDVEQQKMQAITAIKEALAQPEQKPLAKVEPCAVCGEGKARLSVMRSCDTCHSEYAGQAEMKVALAQPDYRAVKTYHEGKPVYVSQPEQEPVGWPQLSERMEYAAQDEFHILPPRMKRLWKRMRELYTTPPKRPWVGLTEEWIESAGARWVRDGYDLYTYARAIEAKLKEKNT